MFVAAGEAVKFGAAKDDDFATALAGHQLGTFGEGLAEKFAKAGFCVLEFPFGMDGFHTSQTSQSLANRAVPGE